MNHPSSTSPHQERVAIIGAGPAGFYTASELLDDESTRFTIDIIDKLPAPFGLLRYGVAPDHQKIKRVRVIFERILHDDRVQFFGGVTLGDDITRQELNEYYDRVIYATGCQGDRKLGIEGEELPGVYSATEFVAWFNGHPEFKDLNPRLDITDAIIVGAGNVALDVARILAHSIDDLRTTDIADHALEQLQQSKIRDISLLARRGPAEAKFTNPELREFGELTIAYPSARADDFVIDEHTQEELDDDRIRRRNVEMLREFTEHPTDKERGVHFRFLESPIQIHGDQGGVTGVTVVKNRLERSGNARPRPVPTDQTETLPAGIVIRSIGYVGTPISGIPFDSNSGVIPSRSGRLLDATDGSEMPGEYVVGWAKRGATGVIGTNKPDASETAESIIKDAEATHSSSARPGIEQLLKERDLRWVSSEHWKRIDTKERHRGEEQQRPRIKFIESDDYHSV